MYTIEGSIRKKVFSDSNTGKTGLLLAHVKIEPALPRGMDASKILVVGHFADATVGAIFSGTVELDTTRTNAQLMAVNHEINYPKDIDLINEYILAGGVPDVSQYTGNKLIAQFGRFALSMLDNMTNHVVETMKVECPEIPSIHWYQIAKAWRIKRENIYDSKIFNDFNLDFKTRFAISKIYKESDSNILGKISENPYILCRFEGVKFKDVDKVVMANSALFPKVSEKYGIPRCIAAVIQALENSAQSGNMAELKQYVLNTAAKELQIDDIEGLNSKVISSVVKQGYLHEFKMGGATYLQKKNDHLIEIDIANDIKRLLSAKPRINCERREVVNLPGKRLNEGQYAAVCALLPHNVGAIHGGPGTGKTYTLNALINTLEDAAVASGFKPRVLLIAPSNLAAQKMADSTGRPATSIHDAIGARMGGAPIHNRENPIVADIIALDEGTMGDAQTFRELLAAIPSGSKFIMMGDKNQLGSVAPGAVFSDIIESRTVPVGKLTETRRFSSDSYINIFANMVAEGQTPDFMRASKDWAFLKMESSSKAQMEVLKRFELLQQHLQLTPYEVQILCSQHKGDTGVVSLNSQIQSYFKRCTGETRALHVGKSFYGVGDKIITVEKSNRTQLPNGELGVIVDANNESIKARFGKRMFSYERNNLHELSLAWSKTIHKSQGSEYPSVILPMMKEHGRFYTRQKLYTGITRVKQRVEIIGDPEVFIEAIQNTEGMYRITGLQNQLLSVLSPAFKPTEIQKRTESYALTSKILH